MSCHVMLIYYLQAGVDPLSTDRLGRLKLTRTGLRTRNTYVFEQCHVHGHVPVVVTMGMHHMNARVAVMSICGAAVKPRRMHATRMCSYFAVVCCCCCCCVRVRVFVAL